jgi:hypothetical protein
LKNLSFFLVRVHIPRDWLAVQLRFKAYFVWFSSLRA